LRGKLREKPQLGPKRQQGQQLQPPRPPQLQNLQNPKKVKVPGKKMKSL